MPKTHYDADRFQFSNFCEIRIYFFNEKAYNIALANTAKCILCGM